MLLLWANLLWLLSIVFLPFPTELLGSGDRHDLATYAVYIGTLVLTSSATLQQQIIIVRSPGIQAEGIRGEVSVVRSVIVTLLLVLAPIIALTVSGIGMWAPLLLVAGGPLQRLVENRRRPGRKTPQPGQPWSRRP